MKVRNARPCGFGRKAALAVTCLLLSGAAVAAATPDAVTAPRPPTSDGQAPANPTEAMAIMVRLLEQNADHVALRVGDLPITQEDAADYIRSMPVAMAAQGYEAVFRQAMDALIHQKAMMVLARKQGLDKDPAVSRKSAAMTEKIVVDAWLGRQADAAVTEPALRARYERDVAGKPGPIEVRARLIVLPTEAEADTVLERLRNGAEFGTLAEETGKGLGPTHNGEIGFVRLDGVPPELGAVMFALAPGQISAFPVKAGNSYYVVRVESRRQGTTPPFEDARPMLEKAVRADAVRDAVEKSVESVRIFTAAKTDEGK